MMFAKFEGNQIVGVAIAPPSAEPHLWHEVADNDPSILAFSGIVQPPQTSLQGLKDSKIAELSYACNQRILQGFVSDVLGAPHHYSGSVENQLNFVGALAAGIIMPLTCTEQVTGIKAPRPHTPEQIRHLIVEGAQIKTELIAKYHRLKQQVQDCHFENDVRAVEWD